MSANPIQIEKSTSLKPLPFADPKVELGFGNYFTDHWFCATLNAEKGWVDAKVLPYGPMALDPAASVFHYGQALFEGLKAFRREDGSIWMFRPEFNWKRMCDGAERLCMQAPPKELFLQGLKQLLLTDQRWVPSGAGCSLYIRPTLIGSEGFLGVRPSREMKFFIILSPVSSYYGADSAAVKIWVEDKAVRAAVGGLGATKAGANYAASLQAALQAKKKGYAQVLWLDVQHEGIEEVGTMNVFFVFKNEVVTPALNGSILPGGVRDSVLQLLRAKKHPVSERKITIAEVLDRQQKGELVEAFGAGTAAVISPIGELCFKEKTYKISSGMGPLSTEIYQQLSGIQKGLLPDTFGWMRRLEDL